MSADGYAYTLLNLLGAGLACYSSYLLAFALGRKALSPA